MGIRPLPSLSLDAAHPGRQSLGIRPLASYHEAGQVPVRSFPDPARKIWGCSHPVAS
jgi:hypothetical protein